MNTENETIKNKEKINCLEMEVKQGRRVKNGSENYRLMTRRVVISLFGIYWLQGRRNDGFDFLICLR